jgi:hypothetical protein
MIPTKRGYIARKYYSHPQGAQSIYEESIFDSYESAYKYILSISEEDYDRFICEIISLVIGDKESYENEIRWTFDRKGKLIREYNAKERRDHGTVIKQDGYETVRYEPQPNNYSGKFNVGELVSIRAYPWAQESHMPEDTLGVIAQTPTLYKKWIEKGNDKYEWDSEYVIDYIRDGYLTHMHISEKHITLKGVSLPEELAFLGILSEHLKGTKLIDKDILIQIYNGEIFVEKVTHFTEFTE